MKHILLGIMIFCSLSVFSQKLIVRDHTTRDPIYNAIIKDKNNKTVATNENGVAIIQDLDSSDSLTVLNVSYYIKKFMPDGKDQTVYVYSKQVQLDEIVFSANRKEEKMIDVPYTMSLIKQKDIEFVNQATSADLLQNTGAVFVQKSQGGGGSPVSATATHTPARPAPAPQSGGQ